jgi:hypothetical protein
MLATALTCPTASILVLRHCTDSRSLLSDQMESPPQRLWFPIGTTAGQGRRRIFDGRAVIVFLRVQEGGCRRCSLGASTGRRCLTLKNLKMG